MTSLRSQLIAWYVGVAAVTVLFIGILASMVYAQVESYSLRESLYAAAQRVLPLVSEDRKTDPDLVAIQPYLQSRLESLGVIVAVGPPTPDVPLFLSHPPPPGIFINTPARPPMLARLLAIEVHPISVAFLGGTAILFVDPARLRSSMLEMWTIVGIFALLVMAAAWRIAIVVADHTLEPLLRTTRALNRFGDGDFTPEAVSTADKSELGELARAYNRAVEQITQAFEERSRAEAEMRQFVADAGHQLRTPLTVIMGYLSAMSSRSESPRRTMVFASMLAQSRRMKSLIDDLITLARLEHVNSRESEPIEINDALAQITESFDESARKRIRVIRSSEPLFVRANARDLLDAVCALVDNALKYAAEGTIDVTTRGVLGECAITVDDRGPGMSEEDLGRAFDRFYRGTSGDGVPGTGLGLSIIRKSIERAGGVVSLRNREGGGLSCTIRLPLERELKAAL